MDAHYDMVVKEREVTVIVQGEKRQATAFTTNPARASLDGPISNRFIEALVRGAQSGTLGWSRTLREQAALLL